MLKNNSAVYFTRLFLYILFSVNFVLMHYEFKQCPKNILSANMKNKYDIEKYVKTSIYFSLSEK